LTIFAAEKKRKDRRTQTHKYQRQDYQEAPIKVPFRRRDHQPGEKKEE
jgi:hypothetical protein